MKKILIFLIIITFSCSNDSENNNNTTPSGPSGNVFSFEDIDPLGQWDFNQNRGQISNSSEPRKRDININIAQKDHDDSLDVGILNVYPPLSGILGVNETITCYIGNYGYLTIFEDFQVSYKIAYEDGEFGEEVFETYTITDSLASVDYTTFSFSTTADLSQFGSYTIEVSTHMPDDMDAETDTFTRVVESLQYTDFCNIHSIILEENNAFNLYTTNEEGISNYVIFGSYDIDQDNNMVILSVTESSGSVTEIGEIYDVEIDENGMLTGLINLDGVCVQLVDGFEEEAYSSELTYIPDENLEQWLINSGYDNVIDGYMLTSNALSLQGVFVMAEDTCYDEENGVITCDYDDYMNYDTRFLNRLTSLAGIEAFPNIEILNLTGNDLDSVNMTQNNKLKYLYLNFNSFYKIDTSGNPLLEDISLDNNLIAPEFDFSENSAMKILAVPNLGFGELSGEFIGSGGYFEVSNMQYLSFLSIGRNNFTSIDLSGNPNLKILRASNNEFSTIDFTNNLQLEEVDINNNNLSGTIDVSMCENLTKLNVSSNPQLICIKVNPSQLESLSTNDILMEWEYDEGVTLSLDCN